MEDQGIQRWLMGKESSANGENLPEVWSNPVLGATTKNVRMKQLEVDFCGILVNKDYDKTIPEGRILEKKVQNTKRRLTKKQLARTNQKMTMYLKRLDQQEGDDVTMEEVDGLLDDATLERKRLVAEKDKEWENRRMISSLLKDLTGEIPGRAAVLVIMEELVEAAWSRLEKVWWDTLVEETWGQQGTAKDNEMEDD